MTNKTFTTTPLNEDELKDYEGYDKEREQLDKALEGTGVTILRSLPGYGKTTLAKHYKATGKAHYTAPAIFEELYGNIRGLQKQKILFWERETPITKPIFIDECGSLDPKTNAFLKANLHDKGIKIILVLNHDEYEKMLARKNELTLMDCVVDEVTLNGFTPNEIETIIKTRTNRFDQPLIDYLKTHITRPRELHLTCIELLKKAGEGTGMISTNALKQVTGQVQRTSEVTFQTRKSGTQSRIVEYIKTHPGTVFSELKQQKESFEVTEESLSVILNKLKKRGDITRNESGQYFLGGLTTGS